MYAIEVEKLVKEYSNGVRALNSLNLKVKKGEIFSLLGPNGAGKSTLINILTTFYKPTSGKAFIFGKNIYSEPQFIRSQIACVAQNISIDLHLSLMENMIFQSRLYKVKKEIAVKRIETLIKSFDLSSYLKYPVSSYSGGVKRRLDIAMNMVSNPKILFLDEPTVGMDIESRKSMWNMLLKIKEKFQTTIFLTTHYLEEAEHLSDTICIMKKGREIVQGNNMELRNYTQQNLIKIKFLNSETVKKISDYFKYKNFINFMNIHKKEVTVNVKNIKKSFTTINEYLLKNGLEFESIEILKPCLEDVFISFINSGKNMKEEARC